MSQLTFEALDPARSDAVFDASQRYRYTLWRCWDPQRPTVNFLMLNPSTADQYQLDPTVTCYLRYAQRWGYGSLIVTNIVAYRATDPQVLYALDDPVGPENDAYLLKAAQRADLRVVAWGTHGALQDRHNAALTFLTAYPLMA